MKCIYFYNPRNEIVRVSDDEAEKQVSLGAACYVSRSEWKKKVRDQQK